MGLDQYITLVHPILGVSIRIQNPMPDHKNTYRKYHALHDWVESLWRANGCPGAREEEEEEEEIRIEEGEVGADGKKNVILYIPTDSEKPEFNCVEYPLDVEALEKWFHEQDSEFETGAVVDYKNLTDADHELSDTEFYRGHNRNVLQLCKKFHQKEFLILYNSWW
jgi:hypothetical protein